MGNKNKLQRFAENLTFTNLFQYSFDDLNKNGFPLKGKWKDFFKNNHPIILELGCGKGEYTIGLAEKYPHKNFIGVDVKGARLWRGLKNAQEKGLNNVAFIRTQIDLISFFFGKNEISEIWITFPDPQIRKKNERKRLTSPKFLNKYSEFLMPKGIIHLKTDALLLYDYTLEVVKDKGYNILFTNEDVYNSDIENEITSIQTFYEKKWLQYNTPIKYLQFEI